jgi:hypothetical protein
MATDRSVNININYKVNTVEVEKGEAVVKRADQATAQLTQSTQKFATTAGNSFKSTSKYIEGMEIELARLRQQIKLTSVEDTARLQKLSTQYKQLKSQVDQYNKSLFEQAKATKETAQNTKDLASQFGQVYTAAKLLITAGIVREVVNISLEMAKLSGNVEGVSRAFEKQIPGAESLLLRLREATQGSVNDLELMQKALQAQNFGIDVQRLPELLEFAAVRAQQTGQSVDYLVNSIVTGIGRKSLLIIDNLGISATRLKQEFNGAALASKSVGDVTNGVANIAAQELQKMGGFVETSATQVDQLTTSWHELRVEISKLGTEGGAGGVVGVLKSYVDSFKALVESVNRGITVEEVFAEKQREAMAQVTVNEFATRRLTGTREENIKILEEEIAQLTKSIGSWATFRDTMEKFNDEDQKELDRKRQSYNANQQEIIQLGQAIQFRKDQIEVKKEDTLIDQETLRLLQSRLQALKNVKKEKAVTDEDGKRSAPPVLKQVVELDFKDPVTGEIKKIDRDTIIQALERLTEAAPGQVPEYKVQVTPFIPMDAWDKVSKEFSERWREIVSSGIQNVTDIVNASIQSEADTYQAQLNELQRFYDEQIKLAGDNDRLKSQLSIKREREEQALRKKSFEAEKEAKRLQTIVNGAAAVINAFATLPYPAAIVASVLIAGNTAAQLAIINKQQYKGYKDGVIDLQGPGTSKSDSIPAMLSRGESVMTAEETVASKSTLKAIRAKKLNDRILKEMVSGRSGGSVNNYFDDSKIVKELRDIKNSQPDIIQRGNLVYETRKKSDTYRQWVRSKSMG